MSSLKSEAVALVEQAAAGMKALQRRHTAQEARHALLEQSDALKIDLLKVDLVQAREEIAEQAERLKKYETIKDGNYFAAQMADALGFAEIPKMMIPYLDRVCEMNEQRRQLEARVQAFKEVGRSYLHGLLAGLERFRVHKNKSENPGPLWIDEARGRLMQGETFLAELNESQISSSMWLAFVDSYTYGDVALDVLKSLKELQDE